MNNKLLTYLHDLYIAVKFGLIALGLVTAIAMFCGVSSLQLNFFQTVSAEDLLTQDLDITAKPQVRRK